MQSHSMLVSNQVRIKQSECLHYEEVWYQNNDSWEHLNNKKANIETSRPVNLYLLKAYPAGIAITKPSKLVPIETISEFLNQIQNDSLQGFWRNARH